MLARRSAPSSMAIYPSQNTPCSNTSFKSCRCQLYCIIVDSILNRQADYISSSIRLATIALARRFAPSNAVAGQPGLLLVISIIHACASFHSFKHGYLSLQKCSLFSRIFGESSTISISHVAKLVTNRVSLLPGSLVGKYLPT